jgi:predicted nucleotidyltransferase
MTNEKDIPGIPEMKLQSQPGKTAPVQHDTIHSAGIPQAPSPQEIEKARKEMEKTKEKLEKFKEMVVKRYPFTTAIGILPPQVIPHFLEEENIDKVFEKELPEIEKKYVHLYIVVPEEKFKEIKKIKEELIEELKKTQEKIWIYVKTPVDVFEYGLDSKFDLISAVALAYPLYDKGFLGSLRVAEIHKSLILRKFEKYVTSYVLAGSIVRGTAIKTSDVDVYVIIDDTDVKRMPRVQLKERLRGIIYDYVLEASELAGVKNKLSPQIYLLTDFWESVKDAHPIMFTFIRDGIPIHDRGTFLPWKALLKMGRIKPSPESIEMFMSMGDKVVERAKRALLDIVTLDLYWAVITPSQALLMLYGLPPPVPKEVAGEMRKYFVEKEKILEKKYIDILERVVKIYKDFEHEKIKEIKGTEIDKLVADIEEYIKRLKELRKQIEKRAQEKTISQIAKEIEQLLKAVFQSAKTQSALVHSFDKEIVQKGMMPPQYTKVVKEILNAKNQYKKNKLEKHVIENLRKDAMIIINHLIEYAQRSELAALEKSKIAVRYKDKEGKEKFAELFITLDRVFMIKEQILYKITTKLESTSQEELEKALEEQKKEKRYRLNPRVFDVIKKELGDFEIIL